MLQDDPLITWLIKYENHGKNETNENEGMQEELKNERIESEEEKRENTWGGKIGEGNNDWGGRG